jgi:hypothetical protein
MEETTSWIIGFLWFDTEALMNRSIVVVVLCLVCFSWCFLQINGLLFGVSSPLRLTQVEGRICPPKESRRFLGGKKGKK